MSTLNPHLLLQDISKNDSLENALFVLENPRLASFVQAWKQSTVFWTPPAELAEVPPHKNELWNLLWEYCEWDSVEIAIKMGVTDMAVFNVFTQARQLRVIYPNGTISTYTGRLIEIASKIEYQKLTNELQRQAFILEQLKLKKAQTVEILKEFDKKKEGSS